MDDRGMNTMLNMQIRQLIHDIRQSDVFHTTSHLQQTNQNPPQSVVHDHATPLCNKKTTLLLAYLLSLARFALAFSGRQSSVAVFSWGTWGRDVCKLHVTSLNSSLYTLKTNINIYKQIVYSVF